MFFSVRVLPDERSVSLATAGGSPPLNGRLERVPNPLQFDRLSP